MIATLGMPCIYYGTEQDLDGYEGYHDTSIEALGQDGEIPFRDRYIRESMFAGSFGAFQITSWSFFNTDHPTCLRIAALLQRDVNYNE